MSASRKRFRPLDPAEERSIHTTQRLHVGVLDDERSYCFSWPAAPLSALLTSAAAVTGAAVAHGDHAPAGPSATYLITQPTVYAIVDGARLHAVNHNGGASEGVEDVAHLLPYPGGRPGRQHLLTLRNTPTGGNHGEQRTAHLSPPPAVTVSIPTKGFDPPPASLPHVSGGGGYLPAQQQQRSKQSGGGTASDDSTLSLSYTQLRDAVRAGLLSWTSPSPPINTAPTTNTSALTHHSSGSDVNSEQLANTSFGWGCDGQQALEREVVELEWRAFHESQRTGAALQRLLSLDAAVPFASASAQDNSPASTSSADRERWRRGVYELWLQWRLHSAGVHTPMERCSAVSAAATAAVVAAANASPSSPLSEMPHPWGSPLLPAAYLYDVQRDYFLNPQLAPGTAALEQQLQQHRSGRGGGVAAASSLLSSSPATTAVVGPLAGSGNEWVVTRRRGPYNFLRWRIERYTPRLRAMGSGGGRGGEDGLDEERHLGVGGSGGGNQQMLRAQDITALITKEVLAKSLIAVELDEQRCSPDGLKLLESTDLRRETEMWRGWLAKV